jgi:hypothetical protein
MRLTFPALALPVALLFAVPVLAADASVEARLQARGVKYEVDKDGDYKVTYSFPEEKRTHLLFVSGSTEEVAGVKVRQIFSPAARIAGDGITGDKALALLRANDGYKLGAWAIAGDTLYFVARIPDSVDAAELEELMDIVASIADDKEIELTGGKDAL